MMPSRQIHHQFALPSLSLYLSYTEIATGVAIASLSEIKLEKNIRVIIAKKLKENY